MMCYYLIVEFQGLSVNVFTGVCLRTPLMWAVTAWQWVIGSVVSNERRIFEDERRQPYILSSKRLQTFNHWSCVVLAEGALLHYVVWNNIKVRSDERLFCRRLSLLRVSDSFILFCGLVGWERTGEKRNTYRVLMGKREGSMAFGRHVHDWKIMLKWTLRNGDWRKWTGFIWFWISVCDSSYQHAYEPGDNPGVCH